MFAASLRLLASGLPVNEVEVVVGLDPVLRFHGRALPVAPNTSILYSTMSWTARITGPISFTSCLLVGLLA